MPKVILMDRETEEKHIPELLEGYASVVRAYVLTEAQVRRELADADALITGGFGEVSRQVLEGAPRVRIVAVGAAGYEKVDVAAATERGVIVTRAATADVECVAEQALCFMMMLAKKMPRAISEVRKGNWKYRDTPEAVGSELFCKTLGLVGFGKVGKSLARKSLGMGVRLIVFDPYARGVVVESYGATQVAFGELLSESDFICLVAALTPETKHLVGAKELGLMKESAYLINVARGGLIDEIALYEALRNRRIAGAALDVLESEPPKNDELPQLENCIVTPHIAGVTAERRMDTGKVTVEEVKRVLAGGLPSPENWVNPGLGDSLRRT